MSPGSSVGFRIRLHVTVGFLSSMNSRSEEQLIIASILQRYIPALQWAGSHCETMASSLGLKTDSHPASQVPDRSLTGVVNPTVLIWFGFGTLRHSHVHTWEENRMHDSSSEYIVWYSVPNLSKECHENIMASKNLPQINTKLTLSWILNHDLSFQCSLVILWQCEKEEKPIMITVLPFQINYLFWKEIKESSYP